MNYSKIVGWILLITGLAIIGWTLYSSYNIFTGKQAAPEVFEMPEEASAPAQKGKITGTQDIQAELEKMIGEQLKGLLPADTLPKTLNLAVFSMLAFVLISGGGQISGIGIKLISK